MMPPEKRFWLLMKGQPEPTEQAPWLYTKEEVENCLTSRNVDSYDVYEVVTQPQIIKRTLQQKVIIT